MRYDGPLEDLKFGPDEVDEVKFIHMNDLQDVYEREVNDGMLPYPVLSYHVVHLPPPRARCGPVGGVLGVCCFMGGAFTAGRRAIPHPMT